MHAQKPEDGLFFVAAVATGIDADGREFAAFAPALDGKGRDAENLGDFADGEEIRQVFEAKLDHMFV